MLAQAFARLAQALAKAGMKLSPRASTRLFARPSASTPRNAEEPSDTRLVAPAVFKKSLYSADFFATGGFNQE